MTFLKYRAENETETKKIAYEFAKKLKNGDVICLVGDLGAGKTTFTKGIADYFKSEYEPVSPTFSIVNVYPGDITINHFDLYRLKSPDDLYSIDIDSYLYSDGLCVIEWPEIAYDFLDKFYLVNIMYDGTGRMIEISSN